MIPFLQIQTDETNLWFSRTAVAFAEEQEYGDWEEV